MHPIDEAIIDGTLTPELLAEHAAKPLPEPFTSYWGDAMTVCDCDPQRAVEIAAREMGATVASLHGVLGTVR